MKEVLYLFLIFLSISFSLEEESNIEEDIASLVLDFIPVVGNVKGLQEALTGIDIVTGRNLSMAERFLSFLGAIPTGNYLKNGKHLKNSQKFLKAAERARKTGKLKNLISFAKAASRAAKKANKVEKYVKGGINIAKIAKHLPLNNLTSKTKEKVNEVENITKRGINIAKNAKHITLKNLTSKTKKNLDKVQNIFKSRSNTSKVAKYFYIKNSTNKLN